MNKKSAQSLKFQTKQSFNFGKKFSPLDTNLGTSKSSGNRAKYRIRCKSLFKMVGKQPSKTVFIKKPSSSNRKITSSAHQIKITKPRIVRSVKTKPFDFSVYQQKPQRSKSKFRVNRSKRQQPDLIKFFQNFDSHQTHCLVKKMPSTASEILSPKNNLSRSINSKHQSTNAIFEVKKFRPYSEINLCSNKQSISKTPRFILKSNDNLINFSQLVENSLKNTKLETNSSPSERKIDGIIPKFNNSQNHRFLKVPKTKSKFVSLDKLTDISHMEMMSTGTDNGFDQSNIEETLSPSFTPQSNISLTSIDDKSPRYSKQRQFQGF